MNNEAGPSAASSLPSRTATSKVRVSPESLGILSSTTASSTDWPSLLNTEMVALGGSPAKLSLPSPHCLMNSDVLKRGAPGIEHRQRRNHLVFRRLGCSDRLGTGADIASSASDGLVKCSAPATAISAPIWVEDGA